MGLFLRYDEGLYKLRFFVKFVLKLAIVYPFYFTLVPDYAFRVTQLFSIIMRKKKSK